MEYFMPYWYDRVDPDYDFVEDRFSDVRTTAEDDFFGHELFEEKIYDGILVSRAILEKKPAKYQVLQRHVKLSDYFRMGSQSGGKYLLMGDCGAFSYIDQDRPPYSPVELVSFYNKHGFDWGVAPDHLIVESIVLSSTNGKPERYELSMQEKRSRQEVTLELAEAFLCESEKLGNFAPFGVVQGWDQGNYLECFEQLLAMGYENLALGGLVRRPTGEIRSLLAKLAPKAVEARREGKLRRLHVFGLSRLSLFADMKRASVTSFDSASWHRNAWTSSNQNYFGADGRWYTAIRIPAGNTPRARQSAATFGVDASELQYLEKQALWALHAYARREASLESAVHNITAYDSLFIRNGKTGSNHAAAYRETLLARPWEHCECKVCKALGVEVIIFRGSNRNLRRGFHNTWQFYRTVTSHFGLPTEEEPLEASRTSL